MFLRQAPLYIINFALGGTLCTRACILVLLPRDRVLLKDLDLAAHPFEIIILMMPYIDQIIIKQKYIIKNSVQ